MTGGSPLGGGYAESEANPGPTAAAVLQAARSGAAGSHLAVLAGPPGVGKSTVAARVVAVAPNSLWIDKDATAAGFVLQAARDAGLDESSAYGTTHYWQVLRPLEYAGALSVACANLVGTRLVLLVGGWGPELSLGDLWPQLRARLAPARLSVVHLDPPPLESWQSRMADRGWPVAGPGFAQFARAVARFAVWEGAVRLSSDRPRHVLVQEVLRVLALP